MPRAKEKTNGLAFVKAPGGIPDTSAAEAYCSWMKRRIAPLLAFILCLLLTACGRPSDDD